MKTPAQTRGGDAERLVRDYLERHGLRFVTGNYRCRWGELDLVMYDRDSLVFVEVRYRSNPCFGGGAESIDARKRQRLINAAQHFLQRQRPANRPARFDVVSVAPAGDGEHHRIDWLRDALQVE